LNRTFMKLATKRNSTRDGQLLVVSKDLSRYIDAVDVSATLQAALDNWDEVSPALQKISDQLNSDETMGQEFDQSAVESPLPRAYQWADGSAYVNHVELVRKARGVDVPDSFWTDPLMYQGGSDTFIGPRDAIRMPTTEWGIDMEGEVAVITGDVPFGASKDQAADSIKLVMLVNDVSLRALIPAELGKGFGFFQSKPSSSFSPVAITLDELGDVWAEGKLHLPLQVEYNSTLFGKANAGIDMTFDFPTLVAHAAKSRRLGAGTIVGSGTVSNKHDGNPSKSIEQGGVGYSCIAEVRMIETINNGKPSTAFMQFGDTVKIYMLDADGGSIFGDIYQTVEKLEI
jgi:fumarylacetoacetate (FAA) hydrolase